MLNIQLRDSTGIVGIRPFPNSVSSFSHNPQKSYKPVRFFMTINKKTSQNDSFFLSNRTTNPPEAAVQNTPSAFVSPFSQYG